MKIKKPKIKLILLTTLFFVSHTLFSQNQAFKEVFDKYYAFYQLKDFWNASEWSEKLVVEAEKEFGKGSMLHYNTILYAAEAHFECRKYSKSGDYYLKAFQHVTREGKITNDAIQYLNKLSIIHAYTGEYALSKQYAEKTIQEYVKLNGDQTIDYAVALSNVAECYAQMELLNKAIEMHENAYKKAVKIDPNAWQCILILNNLATCQARARKRSDAEKNFSSLVQQCEKIYGKEHFVTLTFMEQLAVSIQGQERYAEAVELHKKCKSILEKSNQTESDTYIMLLNNLAQCYYELENTAEAVALLKKSYAYYQRKFGENHPETFLVKFNLGYCQLKTPQASIGFDTLTKAMRFKIDHLEQNFYAFSENERIASKTAVDELIQQYFKASVQFGKLDDTKNFNPKVARLVYDFQLANKGQVLKSVLKTKKKILQSGDQKLIQEFHEWERLKNSLAHFGRMSADELKNIKIDLSKITSEVEEKEKVLSIKAKELNIEIKSPNFSSSDVQKELKNGENAIEIIRLKDEKSTVSYLILILDNKSITPVLLKNGSELEKRNYNYYKNKIEFGEKDEKSFTAFWSRIAENLTQNCKTVYLSTDGVFNLVNISTLFNTETQKFLEEEIKIIQLTSTKDLIPKNPVNLSKEVVLVGNPNFEMNPNKQNIKKNTDDIFEQKRAVGNLKMEFSRLPGTEQEIKNIEKIMKTSFTTRTFLDDKALEENIKNLTNPRILHFATHGYFEKTENSDAVTAMLNSGLVFSGVTNFYNINPKPSTEDGFLSAYEAQNLNLDGTELVILSACETGLGMNVEGEGVFGLQRAFQVAGCKNLIMSLWKVNDQATQELMSIFYQKFLQNKNAREAFQEAKASLKAKYEHPKYWGAFVILGK
ncbi:MAG: CHAT domain-containing protein [Cytophagales bacterium]